MLMTWKALPALDRLMDDVMRDVTGAALGTEAKEKTYNPAIDVRANDDEVVLVCDVPGLGPNDLELSLADGVLTLKGERRYEGSEKDRVWLCRSYGAFTRSFALPPGLLTERLTADLADGVLTIRVPRQPEAKPRRVQIGHASGAKQITEQSG
jgi:HSP20 family protein